MPMTNTVIVISPPQQSKFTERCYKRYLLKITIT